MMVIAAHASFAQKRLQLKTGSITDHDVADGEYGWYLNLRKAIGAGITSESFIETM